MAAAGEVGGAAVEGGRGAEDVDVAGEEDGEEGAEGGYEC